MFDGTDVYEHIFAAALRLNEPIALRWIEPFHGAGSHAGLLAESNNNSVVRSVGNSKLPPWLAAKGNGPRNRHSNRVSASRGLRFRETGFQGQRKMRRNRRPTVTMPPRSTNRRTDPANSGP